MFFYIIIFYTTITVPGRRRWWDYMKSFYHCLTKVYIAIIQSLINIKVAIFVRKTSILVFSVCFQLTVFRFQFFNFLQHISLIQFQILILLQKILYIHKTFMHTILPKKIICFKTKIKFRYFIIIIKVINSFIVSKKAYNCFITNI